MLFVGIFCVLCIETKVNFVNQNKGKIPLKIYPWERMNLAISCRSCSFQLKTMVKKSKNTLRVGINQFCVGNGIP